MRYHGLNLDDGKASKSGLEVALRVGHFYLR